MSIASRSDWRYYIGGEWVAPETDDAIEVVNPSTGEVITTVPSAGRADVDRAVRAADEGRRVWRDHTPGERAAVLLKVADRIDEHHDDLVQLETRNTGKPAHKADGEITYCADNFRFFAGAARLLEGRSTGEYLRGFTSLVRREPIGVIAQIVPWNYPLMMATWKIAPALAAGNATVIKPAEETPLTLLEFARITEDLFPPGVFNVVTGRGESTGSALVSHPLVRMVAVTGGIDTGRRVAQLAAASIKRVHLELGGNAPVIVFDDADLDAAAAGIVAAGYENSGQCCIAGPRVLATPKAYAQLVERLPERVAAVRVGDPAEEKDLDMGPLISERQQQRVLNFLQHEERGEILVGGEAIDRHGYFVAPTLVAGVTQDAEIVQKEVFGPVVTLQRCNDEAQALAFANDSEYGLGASVWTTNVGKAHRAMRELEYGMVWINTHLPNTSEMPHGGFKQSGYGKDLSSYSLEDYTQIKLGIISLE
jgi:1-pyrroline dehydrogenase